MSGVTRQDVLRRKEENDKAYAIQWQGAINGALRWTAYGATLCIVGHYTWPFFRRQTLALKGFITSSMMVTGLVLGADDSLLVHEQRMRRSENHARHQARNGLAKEGRIATEIEIQRWMDLKRASPALARPSPAAASESAGVPPSPPPQSAAAAVGPEAAIVNAGVLPEAQPPPDEKA